MKTLFTLGLTFLLISPIVAQQNRLLNTGSAGKVKIGITADEVYNLYDKDSIALFNQFLEGTFSPALRIREEGLIVELECDKVWRIKVNEGLYVTSNGLKVGSTISELLALYPQAQFLPGEGNYAVYVEKLHMSFILAQDGLDVKKYYDALADFPDDTGIAQILILSK